MHAQNVRMFIRNVQLAFHSRFSNIYYQNEERVGGINTAIGKDLLYNSLSFYEEMLLNSLFSAIVVGKLL